MLADISSKERRARLKSFRDRACVLVVSGENLSLEELSGIPVIAVFLYYPLRTKHSRKVPGGLFGYQHQVNAVCRFGHPGLCITIVQDETVQEALETVVCSYYVQYGTKLKQLVLGPDGSLAQTLAKYLLWIKHMYDAILYHFHGRVNYYCHHMKCGGMSSLILIVCLVL